MAPEVNPQRKLMGAAKLDPETRTANARKAALSRWGSEGRLTGDALRERNNENNRRWRLKKKFEKDLQR